MAIGAIFALAFVVLASVFLFYYIKQEKAAVPFINEINSNLTSSITSTTPPRVFASNPLLFANIRWAKMPLSVYIVAENCTSQQAQEVTDAEGIWYQKTNGLISFTGASSSSNADVVVDCLTDASSIREGRTIVRKVGEGGPSSVYDTGMFNLTTKGKIYLFSSAAGCTQPIIAIHEMGHVLGLDHSENPSSVMYPYEDCDQKITPDIISTLQALYSYPAKSDLYFSQASASQKDFYLSINMTIKNEGLVPSAPAFVSVQVNGKEVKSIPLDSIKPAQGYEYSLTNLFVSNQVSELKLAIDTQNATDELLKTNNIVTLIPK